MEQKIAKATEIKWISGSGNEYWNVTVQCPYCGEKHHHGCGRDKEAGPKLGSQVAKCKLGERKRYIIAKEE